MLDIAWARRAQAGVFGLLFVAISLVAGAQEGAKQAIDLPTSKQLLLPVPGDPQRVNSLPMMLAVSPDGRWVAGINAGYGTVASEYKQSISVLDTQSGTLRDVTDARTMAEAKQTYYAGLTFSGDGRRLYAAMASMSDPEGKGKGDTGNGVAVFDFGDGKLTQSGFLKLPLVALPVEKRTLLRKADEGKLGVPYPAGLAVVRAGQDGEERLLVAENLSDSVALVNTRTGRVERVFDLTEAKTVPSTYPIAVAVTKDGRRAFVALWNASEVAELDLQQGTVVRKLPLMKPRLDTAAGSHPCALLLDERSRRMYVALSNRDAVAVLDIGQGAAARLMVKGYFDTRLPGQSYFGAEPNALALNADGSRLYVANMGTDSIALLNPRAVRSMAAARGMTEPVGFVPTELMPTALASTGGRLFVATAKGKGTGPNAKPQPQTAESRQMARFRNKHTYLATLLYGSLATLDEKAIEADVKGYTEECLESNRLRAASESIRFSGDHHPIRHVIYILRENRTYDQILGDLQVNGRRVGNGDPSLTMYGADVTPNIHKLVLQFGVLDNFFDSGEVSGDGHVWSTAAIGTDYLEKTWQQSYRGNERTYDYEGMVADGLPLLQHIPDVNEASSGYLWTNIAAHGKSLYHFGEYISSTFCNEKSVERVISPREGAMSGEMEACKQPVIHHGGALPDAWGGGTNLWPWDIPRIAHNRATKQELVGHFAEETPDFNLRVPDQIRVQVFLRHLEQWKKDRAAGHDTMPDFVLLRLPNDHTGGTTAGGPTPKSSIADNDLAVGRAVEGVSHSQYWDDTAFFLLEDDAQDGGDHVDAHRSMGVVISKYSPHAEPGAVAFVDSRFYSTVSMIRTMESLLGLPPMNNNDAFAPLIGSLFTGPGDQPAFVADTSNRENGLIYTANSAKAPGAAASAKMDFQHADRTDPRVLNAILWRDAMGSRPIPPMLKDKRLSAKDDDD